MPELMDWEQLERYFAGELAADDAVQLRRWLMAHPEHAQMLDRVNQELDYVSALGDLDRSDALVSWHTLTARMLGDARTPTVTDGLGTNVTYVENSRAALARQAQSSGDTLRRDVTNPTTNRLSLSRGVSTREKSARPALQGIAVWGTQPLRRLRWYTATVLTSAITVGLVGWLLGWRTPDVPSIALKPVSTYVTGNGERARITLPDSNTVLLDVATRLEVPADYLEGDHVVRVTTGEAVFAVSHHTRTPFTVVTGGVTTRVLGTEFLVRRYPTDTATLVAVREGKVVVQTALRRSLVLSASRQVTVVGTGMARVEPANPAHFSFVAGVLILNGERLIDAIPALDRWYDADVRLGDPSLADRWLTAQYSAGSLGDLADILGGTFNVRVVRRGRVLTLFPRG